MTSNRPIRRLKTEIVTGSGQAQVIEHPKQLAHILWAASRGETGKRNIALIWMLFGSGLRINEAAQLKVKDIYHPTGELKQAFRIPGSYTKTGKPRTIFILVPQQRNALGDLKAQRLQDRVMLSPDGTYGGLAPDSPVFLSLKGKRWQKLAFNVKRYQDSDGNIRETMVCGSLENLARELIKHAGVHGGSSHSGRRSLATWMDRKGYDLELIQGVLGHTNADMSLIYIDPWDRRIDQAFKTTCRCLMLPKTIIK
ncbi:MAG: site-specific integrase [Candidatus Thiodiazotropha sp. (ex Epidulcina cf. delphinae)]|nr:site-specific integrase [Candidatus Thiodiazotropha sp. (ex Epidulcina cf. delphinae)]